MIQQALARNKEGVLDYIKQAGCIQFDPIDICGKNHELVLQSRVEGFRKHQLYDLLYKDRKLVDLFDKNMAIVPVGDWPYLNHYRDYFQNGGRHKEDIDRVAAEILNHIKTNGPICSADIKYDEKVNWYWAPTSLARAALDTWLVETGDRGQWLEPDEIVAPFKKEMHDWFGTPAWWQDHGEGQRR